MCMDGGVVCACLHCLMQFRCGPGSRANAEYAVSWMESLSDMPVSAFDSFKSALSLMQVVHANASSVGKKMPADPGEAAHAFVFMAGILGSVCVCVRVCVSG